MPDQVARSQHASPPKLGRAVILRESAYASERF